MHSGLRRRAGRAPSVAHPTRFPSGSGSSRRRHHGVIRCAPVRRNAFGFEIAVEDERRGAVAQCVGETIDAVRTVVVANAPAYEENVSERLGGVHSIRRRQRLGAGVTVGFSVSSLSRR